MNNFKTILGIETSCDETACAIVQKQGNRINILSNTLASSASLQAKYGGVIPEQAAREQLKSIIPVIQETIHNSKLTLSQIDAIAVTQGPGLIGSLLIGVETAKALSFAWDKPLIPVNHLLAHFYACWVNQIRPEETRMPTSSETPSFPFLGLLVSGGHTDLLLFKSHSDYLYLGGTRDDAAGECFDKCARLLGLPYPGGPLLAKAAQNGNPKAFKLPRSMLDSSLEFSFSGLKTAVANLANQVKSDEIRKNQNSDLIRSHPISSDLSKTQLSDLASSIQAAIVEQLTRKVALAVQKYNTEQVVVAGGVAANLHLRQKLTALRLTLDTSFIFPPFEYCTDNAVTTAARAFFEKPSDNPLSIDANPNLSLVN